MNTTVYFIFGYIAIFVLLGGYILSIMIRARRK